MPMAKLLPLNFPSVDKKHWPLWEIFIRSRQGLSHRHVGSLHAADAEAHAEVPLDAFCIAAAPCSKP